MKHTHQFIFFVSMLSPLAIQATHDTHKKADLYKNIGSLFEKTGNTQRAASCFAKAATIEPENERITHHLADTYYQQKQYKQALDEYKKALFLDPHNTATRYQIGLCHKHLDNNDAAIAEYNHIIKHNPHHCDAQHQLGILYREKDNLEQSAIHLQKAHELQPSNMHITMELANTLNMLNRDTESMDLYLEVLNAHPNATGALYNFGYTLKKQGKFAQALEVFTKVLEQKPDYALARFSNAHALLATGDFEHGWNEYEWRWKAYNESAHKFNIPLWEGQDLNGKTILLYAEQGIGDTFQFIRYAKLLKNNGATVFVEVQNPLTTLLQLCPYIDRVFARNDAIPTADYHVPLMSLPRIFQTDLDSIPQDIPYLYADAQLVDYWHDVLSHDTHFKIGICWQGNAQYKTRALRHAVATKSIPLELLAQLSEIPNVSVYSLQHVDGTDQLNTLKDYQIIHQFGPEFDDLNGRFMDSAAIIQNLDLVISVDTSVAHLAGALGARTWLLLPHVADWRWLTERTDTPWYPTMRLFRQPQPGDWQAVINAIKINVMSLINKPQHTKRSPNTIKMSSLDTHVFFEQPTHIQDAPLAEFVANKVRTHIAHNKE